MNKTELSTLLIHQQNILSKIALSPNAASIMVDICSAIESMLHDPSAKCSILILDGKQLRHCAAPNIPQEYCDWIDGVVIGETVGSCGTAAYTKKRIIVEDINTSLLWTDYKEVAMSHALKSCWSTPIFNSKNEVIGTFAVYHSTVKKPKLKELELIDHFVNLTNIALEKIQTESTVQRLINDLRQSNEMFSAFINVMPDLVIILDERGNYINVFGASDTLASKDESQLIGNNIRDVLPKEVAGEFLSVIEKTLTTGDVQSFEYELEVNKGNIIFEGRTAPIHYESPAYNDCGHVLWVARDITERKIAEQTAQKLAYYDPLTQLPNRRMLNEKLDWVINDIRGTDAVGALLFIDLDNFKRINDALGHSAGDRLLQSVSSRLKSGLKSSDVLARVGGDEFIILLDYITDEQQRAKLEVSAIAERLQSKFKQHFVLGGLDFKISCSIGICLIDKNNSSSESVLKFSDTAMFYSKKQGGGHFSFYDPASQTILEKQVKMEADIIKAIDSGEFSTHFQPQVNPDGEVQGAEALIRWKHPEKGHISPIDFIPVAEQLGLIQELQDIVFKDTCVFLEHMYKKGCVATTFSVSVNISMSQFRSISLKNRLLKILSAYEVKPYQIVLEITESMFSFDVSHIAKQMAELTSEGFSISLDDFGTGYSSLAYLHDYPLKELKIDKSFIKQMENSLSGEKIVDTIISLAKNLDIRVVAEGVETQKQFEMLKSRDVDAIQGFLFSMPMSSSDFYEWLQLNKN